MQQAVQSEILKQVGQIADRAISRAKEISTIERRIFDNIDISTFPSSPNSEYMSRPYGFDVHKAYREYLGTKEYLEYLERLVRISGEMRANLEDKGIPIIAILPERVWEKICKEAGLFMLFPNKKGEIPISNNALRRACDNAVRNIYRPSLWDSIMGRDPRRMSSERQRLLEKQTELDVIRKFFTDRNKRSLMLDLIPEQDTRRNPSLDSIEIKFPTPDAQFGRTLLMLEKLSLHIGVVVEAEAIDISPYAQKMIAEAENEVAEVAKEVRGKYSFIESNHYLCPILTHTRTPNADRGGKRQWGVTAILAQYGRFPLELQAIEKALEQDFRRL